MQRPLCFIGLSPQKTLLIVYELTCSSESACRILNADLLLTALHWVQRGHFLWWRPFWNQHSSLLPITPPTPMPTLSGCGYQQGDQRGV